MSHRTTLHQSGAWGVLAVVVSVVAAACTAGSTTTTTAMIPPANRVECSGVIDAYEGSPDPFFSLRVLDAIALEPGPLDVGREGEPGTPYDGLRFAKFGLIIRADRTVTLKIVDVEPGEAVMEWGPLEDPDRPATRIDVGPCPGDGADWIVFSGGLWVSDDPTCVTLAVTAGGRTEQVRLGVEAPCP